ncbi:hypothetical protein GCM10025768_02800 [Microbacterium pseudoresistens]|uniref:2-methylcitrate dehydratase PrpD n=1 Tax=Microbacterium pseudoresistens TaxID=640634 RepID=A0A7Y9EUK4_9MICO|nr:MmgE/PrpD family protein [Microbacterium pseudoresistens]NYD54116.1 2-methylcitrate dehydratase PrpD [Microbacterium pseudoresistens]
MLPATEGLTADAARFVLGSMPSDPALRRAAAAPIIDSVAVMLAGRTSEAGQAIGAYARLGDPRPSGSAWAAALGGSASPELAALLNATQGHALDYDDALPGSGHLSVPILAASLSAAAIAGRPVDGAELISVFAVGFEVAAKTGVALGLSHYKRGYHTTVTGGTFGTTAAAARVLGLTERELVTAFGIAGSMVAGLMLNFGTSTKPLHSGLAARNGVTAAMLARSGATASGGVLESAGGVLDLYGFGEARPEAMGSLGAPWALLEPGTGLKLYPCCYAAARPLDAILGLRSKHGFTGDDIETIRCAVPKNGLRPMIHHRPETGLKAKFSMEYTLAAAALDGRLDLASFEDEAVWRPAVRRLMEKVQLVEERMLRPEDPDALRSSPATGGRVEVTVALRDGRVLEAAVEHPEGSPAKPLSDERLRGKFLACAANGGFPAVAARDVLRRLMTLEQVPDVLELVRDLRPSEVQL